ncbi:uncharacterized protein YgiB involved in biofilm formation [Azospirillum agricola]|uniref:DUF1190 domain-containing protein n=1 Tax=Azospirillum agricola TaxID=1720247 RepID=UPI001AE821A1|nr:DUF1190 domain-containing protein [Azospirillum agricola]MBP2228757.1 uncharacterized protein YgiB involved in biofilm formation [Azospirillum agricola]
MKRSRTVAALLMGGISPILVACGEDQPDTATVYPSIEACAADMPADDCVAAFSAARNEHQASAPRFASREACEAEMGDGACTPQGEAQGGGGQGSGMGNVFVPALVGFMVGRSLSGSFAQPVYFDRQGYARSGRTQIGQAPVRPPQGTPPQGTAPAGGVASSSGSYYRPGAGNAGRSFTVPAPGRSAGFGSTGSSRGFSGS